MIVERWPNGLWISFVSGKRYGVNINYKMMDFNNITSTILFSLFKEYSPNYLNDLDNLKKKKIRSNRLFKYYRFTD